MLFLLFQKQAGDKKEVMLRSMILTSLLFEMIGRVNCSSLRRRFRSSLFVKNKETQRQR